MISTRRIVAAVGLAAGVAGLGAPTANAADAARVGTLHPMATLDSLAVSDMPEEHKGEIPRPSAQLAHLRQLNQLNQLHQVTGLVAPATGLVPGIAY